MQITSRPSPWIHTLERLPLFSACTPRELHRLAAITTEVDVEAERVLCREGDPGDEFFVVVDGTAVATREGVVLDILHPGSFFGELALLDGGPRTATVTAQIPMRLLVLSRREFDRVWSVAPPVAKSIATELARRIRVADSRRHPPAIRRSDAWYPRRLPNLRDALTYGPSGHSVHC